MSTQTAALVTGAASGIGKCVAERFAADDRHDVVACLDLDPAVLPVEDRGRAVDVSNEGAGPAADHSVPNLSIKGHRDELGGVGVKRAGVEGVRVEISA